MAAIWAEVLDLERVGIHDNFFELGGDSLLATRIITRVMGRFKVELPIETLFEAPTVAQTAKILSVERARTIGDDDLTRILNEIETLSDEEIGRRSILKVARS